MSLIRFNLISSNDIGKTLLVMKMSPETLKKAVWQYLDGEPDEAKELIFDVFVGIIDRYYEIHSETEIAVDPEIKEIMDIYGAIEDQYNNYKYVITILKSVLLRPIERCQSKHLSPGLFKWGIYSGPLYNKIKLISDPRYLLDNNTEPYLFHDDNYYSLERYVGNIKSARSAKY